MKRAGFLAATSRLRPGAQERTPAERENSMKTILALAAAVLLAASGSQAEDTLAVSGTPIPKQLLAQNYGTMPKGVGAYDLSICNVTNTRQSVVSSQIYQALTQSNIALKPIGRQIIFASILQNQRRNLLNILNVALSSATGVFSILSTSRSMNVPGSVNTSVGLGAIVLGQITNSLRPVLPPDKVEKFDRDVLEPALVLDGGSCVERTVFTMTEGKKTQAGALSFHMR
jgi:hypothetical protein